MKTKRLDEQDNFYYQCYICDRAIYEGTIIALEEGHLFSGSIVDKEIHHYVHSSCLWQVIRDNLFTNTTGYLKFVEKVDGVEQTTLTIDDSGRLSPPGSVSPETKLHIKREESG